MNPGIQRIFNQVANHMLTFGFDIFWRKAAVKFCKNLRQNFGALVLCTGTGDLALELYSRRRFADSLP